MEEGRENLQRAIANLKVHQAPDVWADIEKSLPSDIEEGRVYLENAISEMEIKKAPDVWIPIEKELNNPTKERTFVQKWTPWMVAASVFLITLTYFTVFHDGYSNTEKLVYSTEEIISFDVSQELKEFDTGDDAVLAFIQKNCKQLVAKCQNPEFKGLFDTYLELNEAKEELELQLNKATNKEQLMKYLIRIEKNKTEVGKDMLQMLKYS